MHILIGICLALWHRAARSTVSNLLRRGDA
jgi:hypothetical protein